MMARFLHCVVIVVCAGLVPRSQCLIMEGTENVSASRLDALEVMLAEEKQLRMKLDAHINSRLDALESPGHECACTENGPAFMAALSNTLSCTKYQPVIFDAVQTNQGGAYDSQHGQFIAPVNGTYLFTSTLSGYSGNAYHVAFVKNWVTNEIAYLYTDAGDVWHQRSTTVVVHLSENDKVWMACLSGSTIEGNRGHSWEGAGDFHSHISGFLVSRDYVSKR